jgi:hypothetical protein
MDAKDRAKEGTKDGIKIRKRRTCFFAIVEFFRLQPSPRLGTAKRKNKREKKEVDITAVLADGAGGEQRCRQFQIQQKE